MISGRLSTHSGIPNDRTQHRKAVIGELRNLWLRKVAVAPNAAADGMPAKDRLPVHCCQSTHSWMMLVAFDAQPPCVKKAMEHAWFRKLILDPKDKFEAVGFGKA